MPWWPSWSTGCRVVDLSADFRLKDPGRIRRGTGSTHPRPDLVAEAVFGLPEMYRELIAKARLVANPGCYPTGMLLGLLPAAQEIDDVRCHRRLQVGGLGRGQDSLGEDAFLRR